MEGGDISGFMSCFAHTTRVISLISSPSGRDLGARQSRQSEERLKRRLAAKITASRMQVIFNTHLGTYVMYRWLVGRQEVFRKT
jgi:hypothetical protein